MPYQTDFVPTQTWSSSGTPAPPSAEWKWAEHNKLSTKIGNGSIDFAKILHQANDVKYFYVEQEEFERPQFEAVEISFKTLQHLKS